jgi:hypothetical protein
MFRRPANRSLAERLESRCLLSGSYVVNEVSDLALSQPLIYYYLKRPNSSTPITISDGMGGVTFTDLAYLDTGTSGNIESLESASALGIQNEPGTTFFDIGVSGGSGFNVSEPLQIGLAPFDPTVDVDNLSTYQTVYNQVSGPLRMEVNPNATGDEFLSDPVNIIGMPELMGKVLVMDPTGIVNLEDMNTFIYNPGTPDRSATKRDTDPGIPATSLHVKMSYGDFSPFTLLDPSNAQGPQLAVNPMVGPNPANQFDANRPPDNTPPVRIGMGGSSASGSFLFDTGAQASFISSAIAGQFGVHYQPGTFGPGKTNPILLDANNQQLPNQSVLPFGGLDGSVVYVAEFYADSLTLQTVEGTPIIFHDVPLAVVDIQLTDYNTGGTFTLDGDLGVNFLTSTQNNFQSTAFNWVTFDQPNGLLGFAPNGSITPGTASVAAHKIFYNNSAFDGNNPLVNSADDTAVAPDKSVLTSGHAPGFANFTSYSKGINGIMVDIANLAGTPTASDVSVLIGNSNNANSWNTGPTPSITVRPGAGVNGSSRVELTWPDGSIRNTWVAVTIQADGNTGLSAPDTFFVGNLVGASGHGTLTTAYTISGVDLTAAQNDLHTFLNPAMLNDTQDFNRDGRVDATDMVIARYNSGQALVMLNSSITGVAPASAASALVSDTATTSANSTTPAQPSTATATGAARLRNAQKLAFRLRKQRELNALQRKLRNTSALIQNPKQRARALAQIRAQISAVRSAKASTRIITPVLR